MNWKDRFRSLPKNTKNLLVVGVLLALVAALPLFIWGIVTQKFLITQKAASGEPSVCVPQGMEIVVTPPGGSGTCHDIQTAIDAVTGDGYTVLIKPGFYEASSTINISGKSNIHVRGDSTSWYGGESTVLNFIPGSGWGFLVSNSSGGISYLRMQGQTPNGMLSIQNSNNFNIGQSYLNAQTSHALDIQRSTQIYISNVEIQSSAGALEVGSSGTVYIADSRIHDSDNAISVVDSTNINILYNLIYSNRERAVRLQDVNGLTAEHNTVVNNGAGSDYSPAVEVKRYMSGLFQISKNIIAFNQNGGINFSGTSSNLTGYFSNNDLYQNDSMGAPDNINYVGVPNQTGLNGNISQDPLINFANNDYCLRPGSPALYGNLNISEFMGRTGTCGTEPTPVVPPVTPPPTSPSAYCPGPNGSQCDLSTCPVCTGPTCP